MPRQARTALREIQIEADLPILLFVLHPLPQPLPYYSLEKSTTYFSNTPHSSTDTKHSSNREGCSRRKSKLENNNDHDTYYEMIWKVAFNSEEERHPGKHWQTPHQGLQDTDLSCSSWQVCTAAVWPTEFGRGWVPWDWGRAHSTD